MTNYEKYVHVMKTIRGTMYVGLGIFAWIIGIIMANAWYEVPIMAFIAALTVTVMAVPIYCLVSAIIMGIYMEKDFEKEEAE